MRFKAKTLPSPTSRDYNDSFKMNEQRMVKLKSPYTQACGARQQYVHNYIYIRISISCIYIIYTHAVYIYIYLLCIFLFNNIYICITNYTVYNSIYIMIMLRLPPKSDDLEALNRT